MADFLVKIREAKKKIRKYKSYKINMDQKINYPRFVLWKKKPSKKRRIRREITIFPKVSKMAIFAK